MVACLGKRAAGVAAVLIVGLLSGCGGGNGGASTTSEETTAAAADYRTPSGHYRDLQRAGLTGNYASFATHLGANTVEPVITALNQSFQGGAFDVYTWKTEESDATMKRLLELRSSVGRLYVFVQLDRVPGGWAIGRHEISRNRAAITALL